MDVYEIRHRNLLLLVATAGGPKKFGDLAEKSTSQISQYTTKIKPIGSSVARQFETASGKSHGWLDVQHDDPLIPEAGLVAKTSAVAGEAIKRRVPVVGTAQLGVDGYWVELEHPVGHGDGYFELNTNDPNAYVVRCRGHSEPKTIRDGWFCAVEPNHPVTREELVLVKLRDGRYMIKTLVLQGSQELILVSESLGELRFSNEEVEFVHAVTTILPPSKWKL